VSAESQKQLAESFDIIIPVEPISGIAGKNLAIIGRPDLHTTLTKIQLWSLTQFRRVLYLDADTLVLQSLDHLLDGLPENIDFAAAPELGYPDTFNAGMMLLTPKQQTYDELRYFAQVHESYDGGDQGLLNVFFGDGTRGHPAEEILASHQMTEGQRGTGERYRHNWFRLSFTYNMEMHKVFRLNIPAVLRYRNEHKVLHFIGKDKPWHFEEGKIEMPEDASPYFKFYAEMVGKWWQVRRSLTH
jgi:glycogenin